MNIDEFIAQAAKDDLEDQQFMTPVQYSKVRPIRSPQIYQLLRHNKLTKHVCQCGRTVINVRETDALFTQRRADWPVKVAIDED